MAKKNKRYTTEFIESSVKLALSSASICGIAKYLWIPESTVHTLGSCIYNCSWNGPVLPNVRYWLWACKGVSL